MVSVLACFAFFVGGPSEDFDWDEGPALGPDSLTIRPAISFFLASNEKRAVVL